MANKCSEYGVRGCPASYYLRCKAFAEGKNCWDVPIVPCCSKGAFDECEHCKIYKRAMSLRKECT